MILIFQPSIAKIIEKKAFKICILQTFFQLIFREKNSKALKKYMKHQKALFLSFLVRKILLHNFLFYLVTL